VRAELVLGAAQRGASATAGPANNAFLQQRLSYDGDKLLDEQQRGVMMAWEGARLQYASARMNQHICAVLLACPAEAASNGQTEILQLRVKMAWEGSPSSSYTHLVMLQSRLPACPAST
jgi:hypothetical protein